MKIAYLVHSLHNHGGIERVLTSKVNYLADVFGYEVHMVTASLKGRTPAFPLSDKIFLHDVGSSDSHSFAYPHRLRKILAGIAPDIAVAIGDNVMNGLLKSGFVGCRVAEFHFCHEKYFMKYGGNPLGRIYAGLRTKRLERMAGKFNRFVVLTDADRKDWEKSLNNVVHIFNPVTFSFDSDMSKVDRHCIAIGRLEPQKNFDDAIAAWSIVASRHPDWTLDIFGNGSQKEHLQKLISQSSLEGKVCLRGNSDNIVQEMGKSSILLMSSRFEGLPMVLLEASEVGLPLVSYDCPKGPSEIIHDGDNGFLARPGDVKGLAEAICRLIEDSSLRLQMGTNSKKYSVKYNMDGIMGQWKSMFESLTGDAR